MVLESNFIDELQLTLSELVVFVFHTTFINNLSFASSI